MVRTTGRELKKKNHEKIIKKKIIKKSSHVFSTYISDDISSLTWHPSSHFFASAGGADKHIRVWHNTAGIKAQIRDLEDQLKKVKTESLKVGLKMN